MIQDKVNGIKNSARWSVVQECWMHRRFYLFLCIVVFATSYSLTYLQKEEYAAQIKIADESKETDLLLGLDDMTAWMKQNLSENEGMDNPEVYIQILTSIGFAKEISKVQLPRRGMTYLEHIQASYQPSLYERILMKASGDHERQVSEYSFRVIHDHIRYQHSLSYHTNIIQVSDCDPYVAAIMADTVYQRLFDKMHKMREKKARAQLLEVARMTNEAEEEYHSARDTYTRYIDAHSGNNSPKVQSVTDALEMERDQRFAAYEKAATQYLRAEALLHQTSYPFAILKNASVPSRPYRPQRGSTALSMTLLAFILYTWYICGCKKFNIRRGHD